MSHASQDDHRPNPSVPDGPLGLRLRQAREAAGMSVADAATQLKLKIATVEALEKEDLDALGAPVYVRGYFNSYARLVKVPTVLVDDLFATRTAAAPRLQTTARVSHSRYLFDRYAKRAVYVVLTASIVVPVILLATRDQLPRPGATLTPLDAPLSIETAGAGVPVDAVDAVVSELDRVGPPARLARSAGETPVIASLGPFYNAAAATGPEPVSAPVPVPPPAAESPELSLHLSGDSWVEVLDRRGKRIEHGVLRAGESRRFELRQVGKVSIGNADAVQVRMNGTETDIADYRRANVARFTVSSDGSLAPVGG